MRGLLIALISSGMVAPPAAAPGVRLTIRDGSVWLAADRVTAGEILAEWARVGQTLIINGEHVPGGPMTLELNGMPEQQALEVVLRSASGFLALARTITHVDSSSPSMTSRFERILVLPASTPPPSPGMRGAAAVVVQPAPQVQLPGATAPQRIIGPDGLPLPDDQEDAPPPPAGSIPPGFSLPPAQAAPRAPNPVTPSGVSPSGVSTPGMIVPPPQPPVAPVPARRPGSVDY